MSPSVHLAHMVLMGVLVGMVAPALVVVLIRRMPGMEKWALPASIAGPGFIVVHDGFTIGTAIAPLPPLGEVTADTVLLLAAMLFWAPVLGYRHRLPDAGRTVYLFTALPLLDVAAVWLIVNGDNAGGLAMITAMIPMGLIAVAVTWNWINREERRALAAERQPEGWVR